MGLLTAFALMGDRLFGVFGIDMPAFRIAGGSLLFLIALEMLFDHGSKKSDNKNSAGNDGADFSIFPMSIPLLSGPGAITSIMLLMGKFEHNFSMQMGVIG